MFIMIVLSALSIVAITSTVTSLRNDGYRRVPTDWARLTRDEPQRRTRS